MHQKLVRGRSPRHRGVFIGKVVRTDKRGIVVESVENVKPGDGLVLDRGMPEEEEQGGSVREVRAVGNGQVLIQFERDTVDFSQVSAGDIVWRNKDPELDQQLKMFSEKSDLQTVDVSISVNGKVGTPLEAVITTLHHADGVTKEAQIVGRGTTSALLVEASKRPIGQADLSKAIGLLGDTPLRPQRDANDETIIDISQLDGNLFMPVAEIKAARRQAVDAVLSSLRRHEKDKGLSKAAVLPVMRKEAATIAAASSVANGGVDSDDDTESSLNVLCRTPHQVQFFPHPPILAACHKCYSTSNSDFRAVPFRSLSLKYY
jgi:putative protease